MNHGRTAVIYAESMANRGGTGVYLRRLLRGLDTLGAKGVLAAVNGSLLSPAGALAAGVTGPGGWRKVLAENLSLPRLAASVSPRVVHLPSFTGRAPADTPFVVTLHDLAFRACPGWFTILRSIYYRLLFARTAAAADLVMVDSDFTGTEAVRLIGIPAGRIRRVYLSTESFQADPGDFASFTGVSGPYAVFVGTVEPRKNLMTLLDAWEIVRRSVPGLSLVVAGRWGWGEGVLRTRLETSPGVVWTGELPETLLQSCISGARLLVYPSLYEGFGLPPLEAASAGVQSVVTPAGALTEIFGKAAHLCPGFSAADIAGTVQLALENPLDPGMLRDFAAGFSNRSMAEAVLEVYGELGA
jgi:glycosyltransferase involved in cell wall biosynthesis